MHGDVVDPRIAWAVAEGQTHKHFYNLILSIFSQKYIFNYLRKFFHFREIRIQDHIAQVLGKH